MISLWVVTAVRAPQDNIPILSHARVHLWLWDYLHLESKCQLWAKNGRAQHKKEGVIWPWRSIFRLSILDYSSLA